MSMKPLSSFICKVMAGVMIVSCVGCESPDGHHKKKVITAEEFDASNGGVSGLPWNRPRAFESGGGMGRMMPQTR
jgi:hypothetical protein